MSDCEKNGSRLECHVFFRAFESDTSISVSPMTTVYDDLGNSTEVISYTASNDKVITTKGHCSRKFNLIQDVNTPYKFSFPVPRSQIAGISAVKIGFGSPPSCPGKQQFLTFKEVPLI